MLYLAVFGFFTLVAGQAPVFVVKPNSTWNMPQFNDAFGSFDTHFGFPDMPYNNGSKSRFVITTPEGTRAKLTVDASDAKNFCIRSYDYAVMYNCDDNAKITTPCAEPGATYATPLGGKDSGNYMSVTSGANAVREFTAKNNRVCMDWCVSYFYSPPSSPPDASGPCRTGFRAYWQTVGTPTVNPTPVQDFAMRPPASSF
ncbi:uncharacterized protein LOC129592671 [Paramacrobiotus metropolitanus]|uniref:uncharacterized protein LOC129592671 n=1 Tax=Paramacrobiotus metropolitanus TaxID=2943436 RepID=UPI002445A47D|nr:uncharacterized protein LOC129592671 [Paramacrobiotus metropolitanus]